ncbi:MAG: hypothetical protein M3160_10955 [Candidatus Eremiobacteraeota bacterium]|nr:hypothetical protein [Candidatus Eremiobacteraeota bacterium]
MLDIPQSRPAKTYDEALERVRAMGALDDETIRPQAFTRLYSHDRRTPLAVVLFHGITNNPQQYDRLAMQVHERGHNVLVPRLPEHGDRNRMTARLKTLTAERLLESANEAIDLAQGLGHRVVIAGISTSGLLCAYFAQYRSDVAHSIPIAPVFAIPHFAHNIGESIEKLFLFLPNFFIWWNPRIKQGQLPLHGYPRFPTHALMQCLRIGDDVYKQARTMAPKAGAITMVTNTRDPAVDNRVTRDVVAFWQRCGAKNVSIFAFADLPENHDIIDPTNPDARIDVVYPKLIELSEKG